MVDGDGLDLATGRPPRWPGHHTAADALVAAPVVSWPLAVVGADGRRLSFADALGPGADRVAALLDNLGDWDGAAWDLATGSAGLSSDRRREAARRSVAAAGRAADLEAALHVALLLATERWDPADDGDEEAHAASGAALWALAGEVAVALAGDHP